MITAQIITLIILGILTIIAYFRAAYKIDYKNHPTGLLYVLLLTAIALLSLMIVCFQTQSINELNKQVQGKCPEYEKIENVYKIKENE